MSNNKITKGNKANSEGEAFYIISIAASRSHMHPQTLRQYDRLGIVSPTRTPGQGRRYSSEDIGLLLIVQALVNEGINLAGVKQILELKKKIIKIEDELRWHKRELKKRS